MVPQTNQTERLPMQSMSALNLSPPESPACCLCGQPATRTVRVFRPDCTISVMHVCEGCYWPDGAMS
ncbi:MAG: hypothetical protein HC884_08540 [Chloroflexaceae bacterium]|nr:hypothetical protein [Chloroflexaceae bacterium]